MSSAAQYIPLSKFAYCENGITVKIPLQTDTSKETQNEMELINPSVSSIKYLVINMESPAPVNNGQYS